ncbi:MAG: transglycosylase SLT domain-containing protein [Deltaproteobacteria bacterium]|nr:transglycosylase SLT domain-containing protein [Deltaproteobacteria bacterium]
MLRTLAILLFANLLFSPLVAGAAKPKTPEPVVQLRQAVELHRQGKHAACARLLGQPRSGKLLNEDAAILLLAQCNFYAGQIKNARVNFARLVKLHPESLFSGLAKARVADCLWLEGKQKQAAISYARLERVKDAKIDQAVGLHHRAMHAYGRGKKAQGDARWLALRLRHTRHPLATPAPPGRSIPEWSRAQTMRLARALNKARRWDEALALLDGLPDPGNRKRRFEMAHLAGHLIFDKRGRYAQAAEMLLGIRRYAPSPVLEENAWFFGSRALGRADRDREAVLSHLAMIKSHPKGKHRARALFYAGWLEQNQGRHKEALPLFTQVMQQHPKSRWARQARWYKAWCLLRTKRWADAIQAMADDLHHPNWRIGGRAMYWTAMAHRAQGEKDKTKKHLGKLIKRHPLTWYSLLARQRLGSKAPPTPKVITAQADAPAPADPLLQRSTELLQAGLQGLAAQRLRHGSRAFRKRHPGRKGRLALMAAYRQAGDFNRPWRLAVVADQRALRSLPDKQSRPIWDHAYAACERNLIERYAGGDGDFSRLLQAIMRIESGFDPLAFSVANARGLMQMIPPTAKRVAQELKIQDFHPDDLFRPETNVRTAAWYIGHLLKKFKRQWPLVAAAYNGGPPNMMRWCKDPDMAGLELDAFVENIPFTESRKYAKAVTTALARYAILEGQPLPTLKLKVDTNFLEMMPDF